MKCGPDLPKLCILRMNSIYHGNQKLPAESFKKKMAQNSNTTVNNDIKTAGHCQHVSH